MSHLFTIDQMVTASVERSFEAMTDFDRWPDWMPNLVRLERLNHKPFGPGFSWREVRRFMGREGAEVFEVTEMVLNQSLSLRVDGTKGTTGRGEFLFDYEFVPKGGLTQISLQGEVKGLGWFGDLMFWIMGGVYKRAVAGDLAAFRRYVESPRSLKASFEVPI
ncbi:MAG TPA: hypothetical protein DCL54_13695 [Alphaproteobacteria bacterium]|nr:hypothetical protein [Alphaproteobacteria bacterium]HAJ47622.1 hypothetical protein [Alphaproteobacteria bacterium]